MVRWNVKLASMIENCTMIDDRHGANRGLSNLVSFFSPLLLIFFLSTLEHDARHGDK